MNKIILSILMLCFLGGVAQSKGTRTSNSLNVYAFHYGCSRGLFQKIHNNRIVNNFCYCLTDWKRLHKKLKLQSKTVKVCYHWVMSNSSSISPTYRKSLGLSTKIIVQSMNRCVYTARNIFKNPVDVCTCSLDVLMKTKRVSLSEAYKHSKKRLKRVCRNIGVRK